MVIGQNWRLTGSLSTCEICQWICSIDGMETGTGKECLERNLTRCHSVHSKSRTTAMWSRDSVVRRRRLTAWAIVSFGLKLLLFTKGLPNLANHYTAHSQTFSRQAQTFTSLRTNRDGAVVRILLRVPDVFVRISAMRLFIQIHVFSWVSCPSKKMLEYSVK